MQTPAAHVLNRIQHQERFDDAGVGEGVGNQHYGFFSQRLDGVGGNSDVALGVWEASRFEWVMGPSERVGKLLGHGTCVAARYDDHAIPLMPSSDWTFIFFASRMDRMSGARGRT